jgi:hypothetical protein
LLVVAVAATQMEEAVAVQVVLLLVKLLSLKAQLVM